MITNTPCNIFLNIDIHVCGDDVDGTTELDVALTERLSYAALIHDIILCMKNISIDSYYNNARFYDGGGGNLYVVHNQSTNISTEQFKKPCGHFLIFKNCGLFISGRL